MFDLSSVCSLLGFHRCPALARTTWRLCARACGTKAFVTDQNVTKRLAPSFGLDFGVLNFGAGLAWCRGPDAYDSKRRQRGVQDGFDSTEFSSHARRV